MKLDIVYEDDYIIACVKPYGMSSQPDKSNNADLLTEVQQYLYDKSDSDEEPYAAIINRLDRPVSGIVLFAKDMDTAAKLTDLIKDGEITKYYQAVVRGFLDEPEGEMTDYILHDKKQNVSKVVPKGTAGAKVAKLNYEVLDELDTDEGPISYLLVELLTGRHHQIRCQMAAHGMPIWGDVKYGRSEAKGAKPNKKGGRGAKKAAAGKEIGLYSTRIEFVHPVTGEEVVLHREPEGRAFEIMDQMDW